MGLPWAGVAATVAVTAAIAGCDGAPIAGSTRESPEERRGAAKQAILNGAQDDVNRFAVAICHGEDGVCAEGTCSGALIAPNVVATARHCVDEAPAEANCEASKPVFGERKSGRYSVTTNTRTDSPPGAGWYPVKSITVPATKDFCGNDIALLVLTTIVPSVDAKPVIPGVQYVMWDPAAGYTLAYSAIGFGMQMPSGSSGVRRRLDNIAIGCVPGFEGKPCSAGYSEKEFGGGDGTCLGDSGSSAFEKSSFERAQPVSFGVLSRGASNCVGSTYTRFDAHRDLVLQTVRLASENWALYPEPGWTAAKPPPSKEPDAGPPPTKLDLGGKCTSEADCKSNVCVETGSGGGKICSVACVDACPDGFTCRDKFCKRPNSVFAQEPADDDGCATRTGTSSSGRTTLALGVLLAFLVVRRRRHH